MEIDLVAHCGDRLVGAFVYTLTLTDIASTWTECVPLLVRTGALVVETIDRLRAALPFRILGLISTTVANFSTKHWLHIA